MAYLLLFKSRGLMRAQDFAERFEISERTVYRDMQALSEVGVPLVALPGEGYRLMEGYYLPPISFTTDEARALSLAVSMLDGFTAEGETQAAAQTALEKIRTVLPKATRRQIEAIQAALGFYAFPTPQLDFDDQKFLQLQEAIHQNRVVQIQYHAQHKNEVTQREVEPLELVYLGRVWLLNGYCRLRQGIRNFRLERIDHFTVLPETFPPRKTAADRSLHGDLQVIVRFEPEVVRWVHERQHFSFVEADDNVMVYKVDSFARLADWLLSWGSQVEVLEPAALRQFMRETAVRILALYQD
ncbi:MAG: YafY family transcriptional regulator [Anaerolineales bacterium]|nr:YafY family transcriptional regulator [Anaerolineales bacterium]